MMKIVKRIGRIYIIYVIVGGLWVELIDDLIIKTLLGLDITKWLDDISFIELDERDPFWGLIYQIHQIGIDNGDYSLALLIAVFLFLESLRKVKTRREI